MTLGKVVIGINGPPEAGKSWLAGELKSRLENDQFYMANRVSIIQVAPVVYLTAVEKGVIEDEGVDYKTYIEKYFQFKKQYTRTPIVQASEVIREEDPDAFSRTLTQTLEFVDSDIVIVDNFGIAREPIYYATKCDFCATLRINNPYNPDRVYKYPSGEFGVGELYPGDCRGPLAVVNGWAAIDSQEMFNMLDAVLTYAAHGDTTERRYSERDESYFDSIGSTTIYNWKRHLLG